MSKEGVQHLREMAQRLRTGRVAPEYFQDVFGLRPWKEFSQLPELIGSVRNVCATTCCAMGESTDLWPDQFLLQFSEGDQTAHLIHAKSGVQLSSESPIICQWFGITRDEASKAFSSRGDVVDSDDDPWSADEEADLLDELADKYEAQL